MIRDITIGQYYPAKSPIHRMDPRTKLFGTLIFIIFVSQCGRICRGNAVSGGNDHHLPGACEVYLQRTEGDLYDPYDHNGVQYSADAGRGTLEDRNL